MLDTEFFCLDTAWATTRMVTKKTKILEKQNIGTMNELLFLPDNANRKFEGGIRTKGYFKNSFPNCPLITVVTVVFNGKDFIEETINSVLRQKYDNVEYIVIDGGSTDGTVDLIKKYENQIDYWVSETDDGLYFAMNKGLSLAMGDWINYMNCGDSFFSDKSINEIFKLKRNGVLYGDVMFHFNSKNTIHVKAKSLDHFWRGMQFVHQTAFVPVSIMREFPFDTNYKFGSDYNSLYQMYLKKISFTYIDMPICNFLAGGLSDNNPKSILECERILYKLHGSLKIRIYYYLRFIECFIKFNFAKAIGLYAYSSLRVAKNSLLRKLGK